MKVKIDKVRQGIKKLTINNLLIILLGGMLLVVMALPVSDPQKRNAVNNDIEEENNSNSYELYLEDKLEKSLSTIDGLGEVEVIIKVKNNGQKIVSQNTNANETTISENDSQGGSRSTSQKDVESQVVMQNLDGDDLPYVTSVLYPEIEGVVIIAKGGDDPNLKLSVIEAVKALFSLPSHKIVVLKMK